uniref:Uncharacterized protein n=1 Tax=Anguilla anguilla TaxID=7936 RepID=A0A0E9PJ26_ANGAN
MCIFKNVFDECHLCDTEC